MIEQDCGRCKRVIAFAEADRASTLISWRRMIYGEIDKDDKHIDLCPECTDAFVNFLKNST